ncbi:hypothetical protein Scep_021640 [Stephania cephalantha]|uniref:Uncharacterized protein n=1 Tax=Stephania cephalantha TaxID=152367 RepID=A0AAP0F3T7_9MAGN
MPLFYMSKLVSHSLYNYILSLCDIICVCRCLINEPCCLVSSAVAFKLAKDNAKTKLPFEKASKGRDSLLILIIYLILWLI